MFAPGDHARPERRRALPSAVGGALATLGGATLLGWWLHVPRLVQLTPRDVAMQPNTALCFVLFGLALLPRVPARLARVAALVVAALAVATCVQYAAGVDLGVDAAIARAWLTTATSYPGRMAPNTAISLLLLGVALALLRAPRSRATWDGAAALLAAVVVALAGATLVGYVARIDIGYPWGVLNRTAPQVAAGLLAAAATVGAEAAWRSSDALRHARVMALAITAGGLVLAASLWQALGAAERRNLEQVIDAETRSLTRSLERGLRSRLGVLERIAERWRAAGGRTREQFELEAAVNVEQDPTFQVIGWIDPAGTIRWVHPLRANEQALDYAFGAEPNRRAALESALATGTVAVTDPVRFVQGGYGFLAVVPVAGRSSRSGFVYAAFREDGLVARILGDEAPGYALRVVLGPRALYERGMRDVPRGVPPRVFAIDAGGARWRVEVWPRLPLILGSPLPEIVFAFAALLALVLGFVTELRFAAVARAHELHSQVEARERAEVALRDLNATLEQRVAARTTELQEANAQLEAFTYTVSHDLRAPLRGMQGFADALREDCGDRLGDDGRHYLQRIAAAARRMEQLIEDLLAYSRLSRTELAFGPVPLERAVAQALQQIDADVQRSGAQVRVVPPLPTVRAHYATLVQVLQNLLANAIKFVAPGVTPRVTVGSERDGARVLVFIDDVGIGVPARHRERIFRVFERLHGTGTYDGTGIGLAIVRKGVARMGGDCGVEDAPTGGSRFWIELPGDT